MKNSELEYKNLVDNFELECKKRVDRIAKQLNDLAAGNVDEEDECQDFYDYFDEVYDIEYRIDRSGEYKSVQLMIAYGGPNIYVDTDDSYVKLYWGSTYAEAPISYTTSEEIDDIYKNMYLSIK